MGGITGTVTTGPTCPVELAGSPCPPACGSDRARDATDGTLRDPNGRRGPVPGCRFIDGTYEVIPVIEGGGPPSSAPVSVTVTAGGMQTLDLQVDSGIR